ncbi:hypothetical protein GOZ97_22760 [Agrobacterium vitis]|uniref:hypothetical protein n=1 Tax=Rhizobium/Agrobacterium group TaxID=227290 RepID=UPI0008DC2C9D|nr:MULTISPECIES: hypothetical protein [Rhizobium/Agrobacterium group]MCF1436818.1 hypothetical protein [Allorhizobium ampelinum]MUO92290.1 hypothetical protein [Agrobacterium vitis]MUZ55111.1 hypothetical protein [Agrobacterium vitis]MUZ94246.1 hypothetical protein [Agrobacterium vitis]MVA42947.1 hypothetical protein [Agrobacterium vitis]
MAFVTRFTIQRINDRYQTEFYMNADQWSQDEADAEEFRTAAKAQRRADRVGGEVCEYQRPATWLEAEMAARQFQFLDAAE